jgi:hypothetical protein
MTKTNTNKPQPRFNNLGKALEAWMEAHGYTKEVRERNQRNFGRTGPRKGRALKGC